MAVGIIKNFVVGKGGGPQSRSQPRHVPTALCALSAPLYTQQPFKGLSWQSLW